MTEYEIGLALDYMCGKDYFTTSGMTMDILLTREVSVIRTDWNSVARLWLHMFGLSEDYLPFGKSHF